MGILKAATDAHARAKEQGDAVKAQAEAQSEGQARVAAERDANPAVRWDYKTIVLTGGFMGRHKDELDRAAFEKHLDELGAKGFELSWVLLEQALHGEKDGHVMIFKRPIPQ